MRKWKLFILCLVFLYCMLILGCGRKEYGLHQRNPVTITLWHNFGGTMQKTMDTLIDEFNSTVGKEKGIIVNVTAISSTNDLQSALNMILNEDPGAPKMPDITTCYPSTAIHFYEEEQLANLKDYFTEEELDAYIPEFVEEGQFEEDGLYVFPFAKSTEVLYLNQTLFDAFAKETGVTIESLSTFEGIAEVAELYYKWTDAKTPKIAQDGKSFFAADSWLNLAQSGMKQLSENLFYDNNFSLRNDSYKKIWNTCYAPLVSGAFAIYEGYSSDLSKTGDLVCSTGSSAGILFYGDTITYSDNTTMEVDYTVLPYPIFENGEKYAIQRGNGMVVAKSNETKEYAATVFLKWFTTPEKNLQFTAETGYLPVTKEAFENRMNDAINKVEDEKIKKMLETVTKMYYHYSFYHAPNFMDYDNLSSEYEKKYLEYLSCEREEYKNDKHQYMNELSSDALKEWITMINSPKK